LEDSLKVTLVDHIGADSNVIEQGMTAEIQSGKACVNGMQTILDQSGLSFDAALLLWFGLDKTVRIVLCSARIVSVSNFCGVLGL
jgi:hypothetical protein